jgi:hypothetical protein
MVRIARGATFGGRKNVIIYLQSRKITAPHDYERCEQLVGCVKKF